MIKIFINTVYNANFEVLTKSHEGFQKIRLE